MLAELQEFIDQDGVVIKFNPPWSNWTTCIENTCTVAKIEVADISQVTRYGRKFGPRNVGMVDICTEDWDILCEDNLERMSDSKGNVCLAKSKWIIIKAIGEVKYDNIFWKMYNDPSITVNVILRKQLYEITHTELLYWIKKGKNYLNTDNVQEAIAYINYLMENLGLEKDIQEILKAKTQIDFNYDKRDNQHNY